MVGWGQKMEEMWSLNHLKGSYLPIKNIHLNYPVIEKQIFAVKNSVT